MKLTLPQQGIYFEQLLYPNDPIYNIGAKIEIIGELDIEKLKEAYVELINQHDAYRMFLVESQGSVEINFLDEHNTELKFIDFSEKENELEEANTYMENEFRKPFDLLSGNLLHTFSLLKVGENFYYLFSVYHHIITDGWGTSVMFQRLVRNYNELLEFGKVKTEYPYSYKEFAKDDDEYQESEDYVNDKKYWLDKYESLPENLFNKLDDSVKVNKSSRKVLVIKREKYNKLGELAKEYKASKFYLILSLIYVYFGRNQQNLDFAVGIPVLNRGKRSFKETVGLFMGVTPFRMQLDLDSNFEEFVGAVKMRMKQDYRHQRFPFDRLIKELQAFNEKDRLFNITLSYERQDYSHNFKNTKTRVIPMTHHAERVALAIYIREFDESEDVKIDFDYNLNYFDRLSISRVVNHFENLLDELLNHSDKKFRDLVYLTDIEKEELLNEFNDTSFDYNKELTFLDLFAKQALNTPSKVAIRDEFNSYSYQELNDLSNQIAEYIVSTKGKNDKSAIGIMLDRSSKMLVMLLGILKSGRAYIPIDPGFPKDRINYIVEHSGIELLVGEQELDNIFQHATGYNKNYKFNVTADDTAYIIYTSGSTGKPKGVEIGHQSLLNFLLSMNEKPGITEQDLMFSVTTYSFDISKLEFFTPLISGGSLYIASDKILADPNAIIHTLKNVKPTVLQATPSFYQLLFNAGWEGNKKMKLLCGGDLLSKSLAEKLIKGSAEVWNMYGPTETTIWSSIKKIEKATDASNIGMPINNTSLFILDDDMHLLPVGTAGRLFIGGDGLAKGYYKNDELTNQKFIKSPFGENDLIYETGDLAKWNDLGEVEFLGRNDNQVKIRGYRIELGEIETKLNEIEDIKDSVVIAKKGNNQDAFLAAFIQKTEESLTNQNIIDKLRTDLPEYMIPLSITSLETFPLTPNKKIDRKALSEMNLFRSEKANSFKKANTELEKTLVSLWQESLDCKQKISLDDNFFSLGGHSLNAVKLQSLISEHISLKISLKNIFDFPTIETLANYLQKLQPNQSLKIPFAEKKEHYDLTPAQYNIWLASQLDNLSMSYNMPAAFNVFGKIDLARVVNSIRKIILEYEILRTNFVEIGGNPKQVVNDFNQDDFDIEVKKTNPDSVESKIQEFVNKEFDLAKDFLLRIKIFELDNGERILTFNTHHIIMDGWSLEVFINKFITNYNDEKLELENDSDDGLLQFKDYSDWQNSEIKLNNVANNAFWSNYLHNYQERDLFGKDYSNIMQENKNAWYKFEIETKLIEGLRVIMLRDGLTMHTVLLASLKVLIYKMSNNSDVLIGTVNAGRDAYGLSAQIGMFVKTLALRSQLKSKQSFSEFLKSVQNNLLEIDAHQNIQFDVIPQSFINTLFIYQNRDFGFEDKLEFEDFKLKKYNVYNDYSRLPILFQCFENKNELAGMVEYNAAFYSKETIEIIYMKWIKVIEMVVLNPEINIDEIDIQLDIEKVEEVKIEFNF